MRIGIVTLWFNRGQATVSRHLRSALDELGHWTCVLARPTRGGLVQPNYISVNDVWAQEQVTPASSYEIPETELLEWAALNELDVVFFDQNYQFSAIRLLRQRGVITIGRFVWESFGPEHVREAMLAYSVIYSLTRCEQERFARMRIESPWLQWGCHPELLRYRRTDENTGRRFLYVGGYLSTRKPTGAALAAFSLVDRPELQLMVKTQRPVCPHDLTIPERLEDLKKSSRGDMLRIEGDPRISVCNDDLANEAYYRLFSSCEVSLAPSRWEGLGLHLFEAMAFGMPTISCDIPPINEVVVHDYNGLLVPCRKIGYRKSGIPAYEPDLNGLRFAIEKMSDPETASRLARNSMESAGRYTWRETTNSIECLLTSFG